MLIVGCTEDDVAGPPLVSGSVALNTNSVEITTPELFFLELNEYQEIRAMIVDAAGTEVDGEIRWSSRSPSVVLAPSRCGGAEGREYPCARSRGEGLTELVASYTEASRTVADTIVAQVRVARRMRLTGDRKTSYFYRSTGAQFQLSVEVLDRRNRVISGAPVTWESSAPFVAEVDTAGIATVVGYGSTIITARAGRTRTSVVVDVVSPVSRVWIVPDTVITGTGASVTMELRGKAISDGEEIGLSGNWESASDSIAVVRGGNGLYESTATVTGVSVGTTKIIAYYEEHENKILTDTADVIVVNMDSVRIEPKDIALGLGDTLRATLKAYEGNRALDLTVNPVWLALNDRVATVDEGGLITAVGFGYTQIVADAGRHADTVTVRVSRSRARPRSGERDLLPPEPDGPGLFRGRGPWLEGDRVFYAVGRRNPSDSSTLYYEVKYRPGGLPNQIQGSARATVTDTTLSGSVFVPAGGVALVGFDIRDDAIIDLPRDTILMTVRDGDATYTDRLVYQEGVCDRNPHVVNAVASYLERGTGALRADPRTLDADPTLCPVPDETTLAEMKVLGVVNHDFLRTILDYEFSEESGDGRNVVRLSDAAELALTKEDLDGMEGLIAVQFLGFDMTNTEWNRQLFEDMSVLEVIRIVASVLGSLPDNTFTGVNADGGPSHPACVKPTANDGRCLMTELDIRVSPLPVEVDVVALDNPSRALFAPLSATLIDLNFSDVLRTEFATGEATLPSDMLDDLSGLTTLALRGHGFDTIPSLVDFDDLTSLTHLDLGHNALKAFPTRPIVQCEECSGGTVDPPGPPASTRPAWITGVTWADLSDSNYLGFHDASSPPSGTEGQYFFAPNDLVNWGFDAWVFTSGAWVKSANTEVGPQHLFGFTPPIVAIEPHATDLMAEQTLWAFGDEIAEVIHPDALNGTIAYVNTTSETLRVATFTLDLTLYTGNDRSGGLARAGQQDEAPPVVSNMLEFLLLDNNELEYMEPVAFYLFPNLKYLSLASNRLIPETMFGFFQNVSEDFETLELFGNGVWAFEPTVEVTGVHEGDEFSAPSITLGIDTGAPAYMEFTVFASGGFLQDPQDTTMALSSVAFEPGDLEIEYSLTRSSSTSRPQFSFHYRGAPYLGGGEIRAGGLAVAVALPDDTVATVITIPQTPLLGIPLMSRLDLDAGTGLSTAASELHLLADAYFEPYFDPGLNQPTADSLNFNVISSDSTKALPAMSTDGDTIKIRPVAAGEATVTVVVSAFRGGSAHSIVMDPIEVVVHEADTDRFNVRLYDLTDGWITNDDYREFIFESAAGFDSILVDRPARSMRISEFLDAGFRCAFGHAEGISQLPVDDHAVFLVLKELDGVSGLLASAIPCYYSAADSLPIVGDVEYDLADLVNFAETGKPELASSTVLHELAHTMGFGISHLEEDFDTQQSFPVFPQWHRNLEIVGDKVRFTGDSTTAAFRAAMDGKPYPFDANGIVPMQTHPAGAHFNGEVFGDEMMTPSVDLDSGLSPFSEITVRALQDIGYELLPGWEDHIDDYTLPFARMAGAVAEGDDPRRVIDLSGDVRPLGPIVYVDENGNIVGVVRRR